MLSKGSHTYRANKKVSPGTFRAQKVLQHHEIVVQVRRHHVIRCAPDKVKNFFEVIEHDG